MDENNKNISDRKIILPLKNWQPKVNIANYMGLKRRAGSWGPRALSDYEMILSVSGEFLYTCHRSGEETVHRAGEVLFIKPEELHSYRLLSPPERSLFSCIHFDFTTHVKSRNHPPAPSLPRLTPVGQSPFIHELFRKIAELYQSSGLLNMEKQNALLKILLLELADIWQHGPEGGENIRLREMLDYLDANLASHPTRSDLSRKFFLSPPYINAIFKAKLGLTPTGYVHRQLARKARELILYENLRSKDAADRLGFKNQFHFSKIFKKEFGYPPNRINRKGKNP